MKAKVQDSMALSAVPVYQRALLDPITPQERHCSPETGSVLTESSLGVASLKVSFLIFPSCGCHDQICAKLDV